MIDSWNTEEDGESPDSHRARLEAFVAEAAEDYDKKTSGISRDIDHSLYAFNERRLTLDDVEISPQQARLVWSIVEAVLRNSGFPDDLRM